MSQPSIQLRPRFERRLAFGHPWVYSNEIAPSETLRQLAPGEIVRVYAADGRGLGLATYNHHSLIAARLLSRDLRENIDRDFFVRRLRRALAVREQLIGAPFYRLVHAEADGFPGMILDRYDDAVVLQLNTAGMNRLTTVLMEAIDEVLSPKLVVLRNDSPSRALEGLDSRVDVLRGDPSQPVAVQENGITYFADLSGGQKTGWFYDQRENRAWAARLARGTVLDCYSFSGGFGLLAAARSEAQVTLLDRSEGSMALARRAAEANGVSGRVTFANEEVFSAMERMGRSGERFDLVIADPPAFVKSKKDLAQGERGYRKLARLAAGLVRPGGSLVLASCSHHMDTANFAEQTRRGLFDAERGARVLHTGGAGPDHPIHPALPESAYLKAIFYALD